MKSISVSILCCLVLLLASCSKGDGKVSVSGTVTWNGAPLKSGTISFLEPDKSSDAAPIVNGNFEVRTAPGEKNVGIIATKVVGESVDQERGTETSIEHQYIPLKYNGKSELKASISNQNAGLTFDLTGEEIPPPSLTDLQKRPATVERTR